MLPFGTEPGPLEVDTLILGRSIVIPKRAAKQLEYSGLVGKSVLAQTSIPAAGAF